MAGFNTEEVLRFYFEALVLAQPVRRSLGVGGSANSENLNLG